jgi:hypothetical protein
VLIVRPLLRTTSRARTQAQPLPDLPSDHSLKRDGAPCRPRRRTLNRLVDDQRAAQNDGLKRRIVGRGALEVTGVLRRRAEPGAEHRRHAQNDAEHAADGFARRQLNRRYLVGWRAGDSGRRRRTERSTGDAPIVRRPGAARSRAGARSGSGSNNAGQARGESEESLLRTGVRRCDSGPVVLSVHEIESMRRSHAMAPLSPASVNELLQSCAVMARQRAQMVQLLSDLPTSFAAVRSALNALQRILRE